MSYTAFKIYKWMSFASIYYLNGPWGLRAKIRPTARPRGVWRGRPPGIAVYVYIYIYVMALADIYIYTYTYSLENN